MTAKKTANSWLAFHKPKPYAKLSLFCFPYAGGAATLFQSWSQYLPETIEVCPVQLPGRGHRLSEPRFTNVGPLVQAAAVGLRPFIDKPFAFFGHSMGALVSFELARLLRREGRTQPSHLFVSGCSAPQFGLRTQPIYNLPDPKLIDELRRLNGTAQEILDHPELMQLMLPIIRDDLTVCQTYKYAPEPRLDCGITAFGGLQDPGVTTEDVDAWRQQTTSTFSIRMLEGDHFFVHSALPKVLQIISESCKN